MIKEYKVSATFLCVPYSYRFIYFNDSSSLGYIKVIYSSLPEDYCNFFTARDFYRMVIEDYVETTLMFEVRPFTLITA